MSEIDQEPPQALNDLRFSDALAELEGIVKELEDGQLDLEDGIARYERGVALLGLCRAKLEDAQQRVTTLMGELDEVDAGAETVAES